MGVAQESLHSANANGQKASVLKLDLVKAYDMVDWSFLRLLLLNSGLDFMATQWIMGCISSANFAVLINGCPTSFFKASRGLRRDACFLHYCFFSS